MKTLGALPFVVVLASACSSAEDPITAATGATVTLRATTFEPATVTIKAGQTVKWSWAEGTHDVESGTSCSPDGKFSSGEAVAGGTFEHRFESAGTFDYFCSVHCTGGMVGKVIVQ